MPHQRADVSANPAIMLAAASECPLTDLRPSWPIERISLVLANAVLRTKKSNMD